MRFVMHALLLTFICVFVAVPNCVLASPTPLPSPHPLHETYDAEKGRADAADMIKAKKITILGAGIPHPCQYLLAQELYKKHGVRWTVVTDSISSGFEEYRKAFNDEMINHVVAKRGKDFFLKMERKISEKEMVRCVRH